MEIREDRSKLICSVVPFTSLHPLIHPQSDEFLRTLAYLCLILENMLFTYSEI
jgi:hypothetical protein